MQFFTLVKTYSRNVMYSNCFKIKVLKYWFYRLRCLLVKTEPARYKQNMYAPRVKVLPLKRSFTILLEKLSQICLLFMTDYRTCGAVSKFITIWWKFTCHPFKNNFFLNVFPNSWILKRYMIWFVRLWKYFLTF